ncbi:MAG: zinc-binding alcohol dehydrogenase [Desulfobulbus sp.]|nr:MAG: zinc-binding alcohol dehydrogenase [Desulfobulbus sp.]
MKAAVVHGVNDIRIEEYPTPKAGAGEVVVKTHVAGICATDIKTLLGLGLPKDLPTILGHEVVGEIAETGEGVSGFAVGDRVGVYPIAVCGKCRYCRQGRHNLCEAEFGLGHGIEGGFAEYVRLPREIVDIGGVVRLAEDLSFEDAVFAEPLSCTLAAARSCRLKKDDQVLIIGAGPMGLMHLKTAKYHGCEVMIADLIDKRLELAGKMGADHVINSGEKNLHDEVMRITAGRGADAVIISLGIPQVIEDNMKLTAKGGVCNIFGGPPPSEIKLDPRWLHYLEITLTGTFASTPADFRECLELIHNKSIIVSDLLSHTFTVDSFLDAVEKAKNQEMVRGIVTFT